MGRREGVCANAPGAQRVQTARLGLGNGGNSTRKYQLGWANGCGLTCGEMDLVTQVCHQAGTGKEGRRGFLPGFGAACVRGHPRGR